MYACMHAGVGVKVLKPKVGESIVASVTDGFTMEILVSVCVCTCEYIGMYVCIMYVLCMYFVCIM